MAYSKRILNQLGHPKGFLGRLVLNRLNAVNGGMNDLTVKAVALASEERVLEIGFGGGALLKSLLATSRCSHYTGLELSKLAISRASKRFHREVTCGLVELRYYDGKNFPVPNDQFSRVCAVNVVYFIDDLPSMLKEIYRVLCPGGQLALTYSVGSPDRVKKFPVHEIETILSEHEFKSTESISGHDKENGTYYCTTAKK